MSEMVDVLEQAVREILELEAATYEVPADLAARTLSAARRADSRRRDVRRAPRGWLIAAAAAAAVVALVAGGIVLTGDDTKSTPSVRATQALTRNGARPAFGKATQDQSFGAEGAIGGVANATVGAGASAAGDSFAAPAAPSTQIARTSDVEVQVDRGQFASKWREANELAARDGGFVVDSSATTVRGQLATGHLTARVPVRHLDDLVRDLRQLGTPIRVNETGRDVSPQLVDYDARIRNAQAREAQLLQLLSGARTGRAVAEIQSQLDGTRGEIEGLQGERAKVQAEVDLATVQATVTEPLNAPKPEPKGSWNKALHRAGDGIVAVLTGLIVALGYAAPIALLAVIAFQTRRRWRRRALEG
ncbi:MAG: hypothetical protein QOK28_527 [Actinomycetota bacterium]|jgi:hypothetical protein